MNLKFINDIRVSSVGAPFLQSQLLRRWRQEDQEFEVSLGKVRQRLSQNQNTDQRLGSMDQM
jgi:hypothetical protein